MTNIFNFALKLTMKEWNKMDYMPAYPISLCIFFYKQFTI